MAMNYTFSWILVLFLTSSLIAQNQVKKVDPNVKEAEKPLPTGLPEKKPQRLLPEGTQISGRKAKLLQHPKSKNWFLKFESDMTKNNSQPLQANQVTAEDLLSQSPDKNDPYSIPMEIHPCQWLTKMTSVTNNQVDLSVTFLIRAEVTTYQDINYILPTDVKTMSLFGKKKDESKSSTPITTLPSLSSNTDNTQTNEDKVKKKLELPEKLRKTLLSLPRPQPIISKGFNNKEQATNQQNNTGQRSYLIGGKTRSDLKEGYMIINRVGRLAYDPDDKKWLFKFEADGNSLDEPPIALLPSRQLDVMEKTVNEANGPIKFSITGQVTKYQNKNYLLVRRVFIIYDRGNFGL